MRCATRLAGVALSLLTLSLPCGAADDAAPDDSDTRQVSLAQYTQELARIDAQLKMLPEHPEEAGSVRSSIPDEWELKTQSGTFEIDNEDLREKLQQYDSNVRRRGEILPELEFTVEGQLEDAKNYDRPADANARNKLEGILKGREYHSVSKSQSPLERFKDALLGWFIRQLRKLFRAAVAHPRASQVLLWSIIGLVILGFATWLYFLLRRTIRDEYSHPRDGGEFIPSSKHWQQWMREARAAAERSDWREAVHLGYWGGVSYLESAGAWKPDRARTPREYLRLLPDVSDRRVPLDGLTRRFELTWYASQAASSADFDFAVAQLEKLGCR
ncbi:MAG TPA: DUF4129 domain-containing protein [Terriglobales bacterium]|jgi:hypothetical protein|nr:DUF4129 domain-containing protein [Terriglobales bacterium]